MSYRRQLQEFLNAEPERAAAWDRDVPADHPWTTDEDDCPYRLLTNSSCVGTHEGPVVYLMGGWPFVTDGHGTAYEWMADKTDPLGGRWELYPDSRPMHNLNRGQNDHT